MEDKMSILNELNKQEQEKKKRSIESENAHAELIARNTRDSERIAAENISEHKRRQEAVVSNTQNLKVEEELNSLAARFSGTVYKGIPDPNNWNTSISYRVEFKKDGRGHQVLVNVHAGGVEVPGTSGRSRTDYQSFLNDLAQKISSDPGYDWEAAQKLEREVAANAPWPFPKGCEPDIGNDSGTTGRS